MREPYRRYTTWRTRAIEPCRIDSSTPTRSKSCRSRGSGGVMYAYPNYWIVRLTKRTVARRIAPAIPVTCLRHRRRQGATTPREVNPRVQGQISWQSCGKRFRSISRYHGLLGGPVKLVKQTAASTYLVPVNHRNGPQLPSESMPTPTYKYVSCAFFQACNSYNDSRKHQNNHNHNNNHNSINKTTTITKSTTI